MSALFRAVAAILVLGATNCGDSDGSPEMIHFRIEDAEFSLPSEIVRSVREGPSGFIRINDPESAIEIVYDSQLQQGTDERGSPLLFSVNDGDYPRLAYYRTSDGSPIICRVAAAAPYRRCGSPLDFKGGTWAVLFPLMQISDADAFRRRAEHLLREFSR